MRYWGYFAAKVLIASASLFGLLALLNWVWPAVPPVFTYVPPRFGYDLGYTLAVLVWFLLCTGTFYLIIWDQRYRCRVCLRRLDDAGGDRLVEPDAPVRASADRVHLPVRPRHP